MRLLRLPVLPDWAYYLLSSTWGALVSVVGLLVSALFLITGHKPSPNIYGWTFTCGKGWGGLSIGPCAIVCENASAHVRHHEFGHSVQNCFLGPFMIFLVIIPSVCRYWYRELKHVTEPPYDSIWFEGTATKLGEKYFEEEG